LIIVLEIGKFSDDSIDFNDNVSTKIKNITVVMLTDIAKLSSISFNKENKIKLNTSIS
jgi:hypothetical protein